jgi:N-acetyl-anhydromuramyl-L-alanine amidase AmpD
MIESNIKASHAGKSYHKPYNGLNSYYIGVEVLVKGEHNYETFLKAIGTNGTYSEQQFQGCIKQCKLWMKEYNIPIDRIVRHSDVSGDNIRGKGHGKPDPGAAFDWDRFIGELGKE